MSPPLPPRAFGPNDARLLRRATIVYTVDDIRRVMARARQERTPCDVELGADIYMRAGLDFPSSLVSFSIDGAGRFKIYVEAGAIASLFTCNATPVAFRNLSIVLKTGAVVTRCFDVQQSTSIITLQQLSLTIANVVVDASAGTLTNVFGLGVAAGSLGRVDASGLSMLSVSNIFASGSNLTVWTYCRFVDCIVTGVALAQVTLGQGAASPSFVECVFQRVTGALTVDIGGNSLDVVFHVVVGNSGGAFTTNNTTGGRPTVLEACSGFTAFSLSPDDVAIGIGSGAEPSRFSGAAFVPVNKTLSTAGPTITPASAKIIRVTHAAGSSGNVIVAAGKDGQEIRLFFVSYAGTAVYTTGAGNLRLAGSPFTPTAKDTLDLFYDATTAEWIETARSINA